MADEYKVQSVLTRYLNDNIDGGVQKLYELMEQIAESKRRGSIDIKQKDNDDWSARMDKFKTTRKVSIE